jgi:hypothetical protein
MFTAAAGADSRAIRERTILFLHLMQGLVPAMAWVNVQHKNAAVIAHRDADVGIGLFKPPRSDLILILRRIFYSVYRAGVLAYVRAILNSTTAFPVFSPM